MYIYVTQQNLPYAMKFKQELNAFIYYRITRYLSLFPIRDLMTKLLTSMF